MDGCQPKRLGGPKEVFGAADAATLLAAILQKGKAINSAGGYLRSLTAKARAFTSEVDTVRVEKMRQIKTLEHFPD